MAVALVGTPDLSVISDRIVGLLQGCLDSSPLWNPQHVNPPPFNITLSNSHPESVRKNGDCQLSFYLFHVSQNKHQLNTPYGGGFDGRNLALPFKPLPLDLYYLLTAYEAANATHEQKAMTIAMKCLYEHSIFRTNIPVDGQSVPEEFEIVLEPQTFDELGRLWQAAAVPFRLSAIYKVSVVFITPEATTAMAAPVTQMNANAQAPVLPQLEKTSATLRFIGPDAVANSYPLSPAIVAPGDVLVCQGHGLATDLRVFLSSGSADVEVTVWPFSIDKMGTRLEITIPNSVGVPPVSAPAPGDYSIFVQRDSTSSGITQHLRSASVPFRLAPRVDVGASPPILTPDAGGLFSLGGVGFGAGTQVALGAQVLTSTTTTPPAAGDFNVGGSGTTISFMPPAGIPSGRYSVRVSTNGVQAAPAWWVDL
jgi:hypothetical protein